MSAYKAWKQFERQITRELKEVGLYAVRNWGDQFEGGSTIDIIAPPYGFQLKYGKKPNLLQAFEEASKAKNLIPVGLVRFAGKKKTLAVVEWRVLKSLIGAQ